MDNGIYVAVIGDVVESRLVEDREDLQKILRAALEQVNSLYEKGIASKFVLTIGDEFQGLLHHPGEVVGILAQLRSAVHPIDLRFGLGMGGLDTALEPFAVGMDGPCFHRARAALERAHDENVPIEVEADKIDNALRIYAFLWAGFQRRWTNRQMQVIDLSLIGKSGREIAAQLEVTPSAVSQHLHAAGANLLVKATKYWQDELEEIYSELE